MKRLIAAFLMVFILFLFAAALADGLFPAKADNGLWGYINVNAEWVIAPQWTRAMHFRGDYAVVSDREETEEDWYSEGIIDSQGNLLINCTYICDEGYDGLCYGGIDTGIWSIWTNDGDTEKWGYFDIPSGYFSGLIYGSESSPWVNGYLMPVLIEGQIWYIRRDTGEHAVGPVKTTSFLWEMRSYIDGYVYIEDTTQKDYFLSESGGIAYPSAAYSTDASFSCFGLIPAQNKRTGLWGYLSMDTGELAIDAAYLFAYDFPRDGYACVQLADGTYGHIDTRGNLLASGFLSRYEFFNGLAYVKNENVLINTAGDIVLAIPQGYRPDSPYGYSNAIMDNVVFLADRTLIILSGTDPFTGYGVMNLNGQWVLPPEYSFPLGGLIEAESSYFANGLQPLARQHAENSKYAYFNADGQQITDFIYDWAGTLYRSGLARVYRDGLSGYINQQGIEVVMWDASDEQMPAPYL